MSALEAYTVASEAGVLVWAEGGKLRYLATSEPLPDLLAMLRRHRVKLLELLGETPICRPCGRRQHQPDYICSPEQCPTWTEPDPHYPIAPAYWPGSEEIDG